MSIPVVAVRCWTTETNQQQAIGRFLGLTLMSTKNLLGSALQTSHLEFFSTFYRRLLNVG
jgi:hypothetical protein